MSFRLRFMAATIAAALSLPTLTLADDQAVRAAAAGIRPNAIAAHMRFLADDALEGRETGSRGFEVAAAYVSARFAALGLEPAGADGSWYQPIRFRTAKLIADKSSVSLTDGSQTTAATMRTDFVIRPDFARADVDVTAPLVFVGFGLVAPELHRDDYAGIDARGKIVVVITGAPPGLPHNERAYYSSARVKEEQAAAHGAVGIVSIRSVADEARYPFEKLGRDSDMLPMKRLEADGTPAEDIAAIRGRIVVSRAFAQKLFAHAPVTVENMLKAADENGKTSSFPLDVTLAMRTATEFGEVRSENVVARLRGSDAKLRNEDVVVSAHLDHLGVHNNSSGTDRIYNGAYDNASGIACLLEIARAFTSMKERPRRSIVFAAFTGEEKGEDGSGYLAQHGAGQPIVADINMDMFLMLYPVRDLVVFGGEHSTLGRGVEALAGANGFTLSPDPNPEEVRFIRSDQYSFVRQGIPAIILKAGTKSGDPAIDGDKTSREWLRTIYHSPKDQMGQPMDFDSGARYARTNFALAVSVANADARPRWNDNDFFAGKFARSPAQPGR